VQIFRRARGALAAVALAALLAAQPARAQVVSLAWTPSGRLAAAINVTNASGATALPSGGHVAWLCNIGSNDAYVAFGTSNSVSTTATAGSWLKQGKCANYNLYPYGNGGLIYTYIAAITASSTTTIAVETGDGTPPLSTY